MNLKLFRYRERFNVVSGLSDHSLDSLGVVPLISVALEHR